MRRARSARCVLGTGLLLSAGLAAEPGGTASEEDASALLERAFAHLYADDYVQTLELVTRAASMRPLSRTIQIARKQSVRPGKALVRFLAPYEVRRTGILILENERESDDLWVYLPALGMTRRLSAAQRGDAFFGTDLSYEDVEPKRTSDYVLRRAAPEASGEDCIRIEASIRENVESSYDGVLFCIEPERAVILWTEFYRAGAPVKRLEIDPASLRLIGGRLVPFRMTMRTLRTGSETLVSTQRYERLDALPDSLFSTRNLESGDAAHDRQRSRGKAEDPPVE